MKKNYLFVAFLATFFLLFTGKSYAQPTSSSGVVPTALPNDVFSLFSNAYDPKTTANFNPGWSPSTVVTEITLDTVKTKQYTAFNFQGIQFPGGGINVSSMNYLHVDIWTADVTTFDLYLINTTGGVVEQKYSITPTASGWKSIDIPLTAYSNVKLSKVEQIKLQATPFSYPNGTTTLYLENLYFWKNSNVPTITGFDIPDKVLGDADFTLPTPTSNSTGGFTYSVVDPSVATLSGTTVHILKVGTTDIIASQAADANYAAGSITSSLTVNYAAPSDSAKAPAHLASDVLSVFSNSYTNLSGLNFNPSWGQSTTVSQTVVAGANTLVYNTFNYQGIELNQVINVSSYSTLHIDFWSPNATSFDAYLVYANGAEEKFTVYPTNNGWNSFDIALTHYTTSNLTSVFKFKFQASPFGSSVAYLQNIYFWKPAGLPTLSNFTVPTKTVGDTAFVLTAPTSNSTGTFTYTSSDASVATIVDSTVTIIGPGTCTITAFQAADVNYSAGSIFTTFKVNYQSPTTAAPTPLHLSTEVLSLFSDTYTKVPQVSSNFATTWAPYWNQNPAVTVSKVSVAGVNTIKFDNLNYQGTEFTSPIDVSTMTTIHLDLWTPNCTQLEFYLINSNGANNVYRITPTANTWNSIDIPLSYFSNLGVSLSDINQFKFVATPYNTSVVYLENIYFWRPAGSPSISGFTIPTKTLGSAPFKITRPTTNSTGTFSYASNNSAVATIVDSTITIVGVGTATITATQAADVNYSSGVITTTFTVVYPPPSTNPPIPTVASSNVTSLYSDSYTNVSGTDFYPNWGQTTQTAPLVISGNNIKEYYNLNYQGIQISGSLNVSTKKFLHVDIWTPNCTALDVRLINTTNGTVQQAVTVNPTLSGWNSFDIPLSAYNLIDLTKVNQLSFTATPYGGSFIYIDNLYFYTIANPTWTGTASSAWSNPSNWSNNAVPIPGLTVTIPSTGVTNYPMLSSDVTLTDVVLNGNLSLNGKNLTVTSSITGAGYLKGATASSLSITSSVSNTLKFGTTGTDSVLNNLTLAGTGSYALSSGLALTGLLTVSNGTLNTNGNLTLKSTSIANTALVAPVGGSIVGAVTVERFIPQGVKAYRELSTSGVYRAGSLFSNWQEAGRYTTGFGTYVTGKTGAASGVDATTGLDYSTGGFASAWTANTGTWAKIGSTKLCILDPYTGYHIAVFGDRATMSLYPASNFDKYPTMFSSTVLRAKGSLVYGTIDFTTAGVFGTNGSNYNSTVTKLQSTANTESFIANPYAAPVNWNSLTKVGLTTSYSYIDPTFLVGGLYQVITTYNGTSGTNNNPSKSKINQYIQPGQAFWVYNDNGVGTREIIFTENSKAVASTKTAVFGANQTVNRIAMSLWNSTDNIDGAVAVFDNNFSKNYGNEDSRKNMNPSENILIADAGLNLSIDGLPLPAAKDSIALQFNQLKSDSSYRLNVDLSDFSTPGFDVYLKDNYLHTNQKVNGTDIVSFIPSKNNAATYTNRFVVNFKPSSTTLAVLFTAVKAQPSDKNINITWNTANESKMATFEVEKSTNGISFSSINSQKAKNTTSASYTWLDKEAATGTNYFRIKATEIGGKISYSDVVTVNINNIKGTISVYPNPITGNSFKVSMSNLEKGTYSLGMYSAAGKLVVSKSINYTSGVAIQTIEMNSKPATGIYTLKMGNYQTEVIVK